MTDEQIQNLVNLLCELQEKIKILGARVEELEAARKKARYALESIRGDVGDVEDTMALD